MTRGMLASPMGTFGYSTVVFDVLLKYMLKGSPSCTSISALLIAPLYAFAFVCGPATDLCQRSYYLSYSPSFRRRVIVSNVDQLLVLRLLHNTWDIEGLVYGSHSIAKISES